MARTAENKRTTKETDITVSVNLDGAGKASVGTGVGFFDHMLDALARHSLVDIELSCKGDLEVDGHHTVEDVGIALGEAINTALGDKAGIERFGEASVVLDEAQVHCVIDLCGRTFVNFDCGELRGRVGEFDAELAEVFFSGLAGGARATIHVRKICGVNKHHIIESAFKAAARALRNAVEFNPRIEGVPSTKGKL